MNKNIIDISIIKIDPCHIPENDCPKNLDDFICKICAYLIYDPYECENCGTPYCKDCIEVWHQKSGSCPIKCGQTLKIKPAHRFIRKMINEIKVKCQNKNCPVVTTYEKVFAHLEDCEYNEIKCPNIGCSEKFLKKEQNEHLKVCKFKVIKCERCCEIVIPVISIEGTKSINILNEDKKSTSENNSDQLIYPNHDCIKILSTNLKELRQDYNHLVMKTKKYEKDIKELIDKTTVLMCNITYRCDNAHPLVFKPKWTSTCSCCGLIKICTRWECSSCNKFYCLDCVKLLNSVYCPNFHTFLFGDRGNYLCDICGGKKTRGGDLSLHDPVCDFDVCDTCVVKLFPNIMEKRANNS